MAGDYVIDINGYKWIVVKGTTTSETHDERAVRANGGQVPQNAYAYGK